MIDIDFFKNTIIDLIAFNEDLLASNNFKQVLSKKDKATELYDRYCSVSDKIEFTESQARDLCPLQSKLNETNSKVRRFLEVTVVNNNIKQKILNERKNKV